MLKKIRLIITAITIVYSIAVLSIVVIGGNVFYEYNKPIADMMTCMVWVLLAVTIVVSILYYITKYVQRKVLSDR